MTTRKLLLFLLLPLLLVLAGCNVVQPLLQSGPTPTPTECGCSAEGPLKATPTGDLFSPAGPAQPGDGTPAPALETYRDRWDTYASKDFGFSFEYPAAYTSADFGFCAVREDNFPPKGGLFALGLGSRTALSLFPTSGDASAAAEAFRTDPESKEFTFDAPQQRTVGGVPAVVLPYRSGGTGRYGEVVFWVKDGTLYRLDTGVPSACDIPALNLRELDAYSRLLESLQFQ